MLFDQVPFPDAVQLPDFLFASARRCRVRLPFKIDQLIDRILAGYAADHIALMVEHAIDEVCGYAHIERAVALAGEDVGAVTGVHDCRPAGIWGDNVMREVGILGILGRCEIPIRRTDTSDRAA